MNNQPHLKDDLRVREEAIRTLSEAANMHKLEAIKWGREQDSNEDRISNLSVSFVQSPLKAYQHPIGCHHGTTVSESSTLVHPHLNSPLPIHHARRLRNVRGQI